MKCSICGIRINSVDEAAEEGCSRISMTAKQNTSWPAPGCAETFLHEGEHGEMEVKEEYRGKLRYLAKRTPEPPQEHLAKGIAILENEPGKLN